MLLSILALLLTTELIILGPGVLSPADKNVLETVARRRLDNGWTLTKNPDEYEVLIGLSDCRLLDQSGWLTANGNVYTALVVDCEAGHHRGQMKDRGLLADVNSQELGHKRGWVILK